MIFVFLLIMNVVILLMIKVLKKFQYPKIFW